MPGLPQSECRRCGTCCRKSSPTLHPEDRDLFDRGILSFSDVYTLREGEFAFDHISKRLIQLDGELIKVREKPGSRVCRYLLEDTSTCSLYASRPVQCRTLECWNPEPLIERYKARKLNRLDLVPEGQIRDLVQYYEARASFVKLARHFRELADGGPEKPILDMLNFDLYIRDFVVEHSVLDPATLPFHFGRPMVEGLSGFGYRLEGDRHSGFVLVASG